MFRRRVIITSTIDMKTRYIFWRFGHKIHYVTSQERLCTLGCWFWVSKHKNIYQFVTPILLRMISLVVTSYTIALFYHLFVNLKLQVFKDFNACKNFLRIWHANREISLCNWRYGCVCLSITVRDGEVLPSLRGCMIRCRKEQMGITQIVIVWCYF